jgi:hypothetical protein
MKPASSRRWGSFKNNFKHKPSFVMRKVQFTLCRTDVAYDQQSEQNLREREGHFHEWGSEAHGQGKNLITVTVGIVEEIETGQIFLVIPTNIKFIES